MSVPISPAYPQLTILILREALNETLPSYIIDNNHVFASCCGRGLSETCSSFREATFPLMQTYQGRNNDAPLANQCRWEMERIPPKPKRDASVSSQFSCRQSCKDACATKQFEVPRGCRQRQSAQDDLVEVTVQSQKLAGRSP